ncbi:MAG: hypothetical protein KDB82_06035 [Planctomycetes bacterium]|nr:hypothetical protein [Planctomycetota bacterium]
MLKLPTNAGEWGFVIVLTVLFCGLAFAVIYSQVLLHDMKEEQAVRDTESTLRVLAAQVKQYRMDHGELKEKLTDMGIDEEALETRHAIFDDKIDIRKDSVRIQGTLKKYGQVTYVAEFNPKSDALPQVSIVDSP